MRKVWFVIVILTILFLSTVVANAESVTSKILEISDVKNTVSDYASAPCDTIQGYDECKIHDIYGIHQEGNKAVVYYSWSVKNKGKLKISNATLTLIRFNSGKWFETKWHDYIQTTKK